VHTSEIDQFVEQLRSGNRQEARQGLLACLDAGLLDAHYYLASAASEDGDLLVAQAHLSLLEQAAWSTSDSRLHVLASMAYRMMLGSPSRECSDYLSLAHLVRGAELGSPDAQSSLAHFYRRGSNGARKDITQFEHWIEKAVAHEEPAEAAVLEYVEHRLSQKKSVPQKLIEYLLPVAAQDRAVQRLLAKASAA
jgi:TPR repeat protein